MKAQVAPYLPWRPEHMRLALRGRVLLRLRSGDAPEAVPVALDVRSGAAQAATRLDVGAVQRTLQRFSPKLAITRSFHARANVGRAGHRHVGFDEHEEAIGLSRSFRVDLDPKANILDVVAALRDLGHVESATPYYLAQTPFSARSLAESGGHAQGPSAFEIIGAERARAMQQADPTVVVAVVDSGVALRHAELLGCLRPGYDSVDLPTDQISRNVRMLGDSTGRDREPLDEVPGHGTACTGLITARGLHVEPGLALGSPVLPVRALAGARLLGQAEATALGGLADLDVAVKWAVDSGARVINMSFGTPASALREDDPVPHSEIARYALGRGCLLVAAAGNDGGTDPYYPAALPGVIAVGSVDARSGPSSFTSRGPHVALCAPGEKTRCVALQGYQENSGTSFAAPLVSAACALLLARSAAGSQPLPAAMVRSLLVQSAAPFATGSDQRGCGGGVLDVPAALAALDEILAAEDEPALSAIGAAS